MEVMLRDKLVKQAWLEAYVEAGPHTNRLIERLLRRGANKIVVTGNQAYQQNQQDNQGTGTPGNPNQGVVIINDPSKQVSAPSYGESSVQTR